MFCLDQNWIKTINHSVQLYHRDLHSLAYADAAVAHILHTRQTGSWKTEKTLEKLWITVARRLLALINVCALSKVWPFPMALICPTKSSQTVSLSIVQSDLIALPSRQASSFLLLSWDTGTAWDDLSHPGQTRANFVVECSKEKMFFGKLTRETRR